MKLKKRQLPDGSFVPSEQAAAILADIQMSGYSMVWRDAKGGMKRNAFLRNDSARYSYTYEPESDEWRIWDRTGNVPSRVMLTWRFATYISRNKEVLNA